MVSSRTVSPMRKKFETSKNKTKVRSGSHLTVPEDGYLLRYCTLQSGRTWPTFHNSLLSPSSWHRHEWRRILDNSHLQVCQPTNQKANWGRSPAQAQASSLPRWHHTCAQGVLLEMVHGLKLKNGNFANANGVSSRWKPRPLQLGSVAADGRLSR
jgi:hypothetical protein